MDSSPSKRRKISPTTSLPVEAPRTPSRVLRGEERYPSFASPTKATLSRHNPQLLRRPASSGTNAARPGSRGSTFATSEIPSGLGQDAQVGGSGSNTQEAGSLRPSIENGNDSALRKTRAVSQPLSSRLQAIRGGMSARPRRLSRSPAKRPEGRTQFAAPIVDENVNPFQKTGLRRSPQASQNEDDSRVTNGQNQTGPTFDDISNPFRKTGLMRSPISSQATAPIVNQSGQEERQDGMIYEKSQTSGTQGEGKRRSPRLSETATVEDPNEARAGGEPHETLEAQGRLGRRRSARASESTTVASTQSEREEQREEVVPERLQPPAQPEASNFSHNHQQLTSPIPVQRPPRSVASQVAPGVLHSRTREEPELPLTPTQRGLSDPIVTTPPSGIHDTPSKRARRNKKLGEKLKSSPLKPQPARTVEVAEVPSAKIFNRRRSARFLVPEDPNAAKKKARDDLLKELQQIQADIALVTQENERLRLQFSSSKHPDPDELLAVLLRSTIPDKPSKPESKPKDCLKNLRSFMPFSSRRIPQRSATRIIDKPLPSHLPVAVDDPLPYLQAFTPLTFSSTITLLPATPTLSDGDESSIMERPIMQQHHITARSQSGLFAAHLAMTVDTNTSCITSIEIEKLDPNAQAELGTFMRSRIKTNDLNADYTLGRDISVLCWAMGRWYEVSIQRARAWCTVNYELGSPEARAKSIGKLLTKRKRKRAVENEEDVVGDLAEASEETKKLKWTTKELLPYMGRKAMEIVDEERGVEIRFEWKLEFDWTGEIESVVSASARMPESWQEEDERRSLAKVPETFDRMVKKNGTLDAVRALVALLMPPA